MRKCVYTRRFFLHSFICSSHTSREFSHYANPKNIISVANVGKNGNVAVIVGKTEINRRPNPTVKIGNANHGPMMGMSNIFSFHLLLSSSGKSTTSEFCYVCARGKDTVRPYRTLVTGTSYRDYYYCSCEVSR